MLQQKIDVKSQVRSPARSLRGRSVTVLLSAVLAVAAATPGSAGDTLGSRLVDPDSSSSSALDTARFGTQTFHVVVKRQGFGEPLVLRTFATLSLRGGKSIKWVSRQLGHKSVKVTLDTYTHVLPDEEVDLSCLPDLGAGTDRHSAGTSRKLRSVSNRVSS